MIFNFLQILKEKSFTNVPWGSFRLWTFIFQVESVRFFRYEKLIFSKENIGLFSEDFLENISVNNMLIYNSYSFNLQFKKLTFLLKEVNSNLFLLRSNNVLPNDLVIQNFLQEFRKGLYLLYNNFFVFSTNSLYVDYLKNSQYKTNLINKELPIHNKKQLMFEFDKF